MTRAELIAALEAAPGPSRELFVEAYRIAHNLENWQGRDPLSFARFAELLDAEAWLDAAMTLVPGDLDWALGSSRGVPTYNAFLFQRDDNSTHAGEAYHAKTPAIALCAAALKAGEGKDG